MNPAELSALYEEKLRPRLSRLNSLRRESLVYQYISVTCLLGLMGHTLWLTPHPNRYLFALAGVLLAALLVCGYFGYKKFALYRKLYKKGVVSELVRLVDKSFVYDPKEGVSRDTYWTSKLFLKEADSYTSDDRIRGQIGSADFEMAEVHSQYVTRGRNNRKRTHTIFHGLFFHADFPKSLRGDTFVLPDTAQRLLGSWLGHFFQDINPARENLIKLENPKFEKHFVVYGADQVEARYVLTPKMMERILQFKRRVGRPLYLAFRRNRLYLAVPTGPLFEPPLLKSPATFRDMKRMVEIISLATELVVQLELNTQLWKAAG